jgi:hypothetical protein
VPKTWSEADLNQLIADQAREAIDLEFKRSAALAKTDQSRSNLSKDVSAMANSAGGVILYSVVETDSVATGIDGGSIVQVISPEWIEQVLISTIQRRIDGLAIQPIPLASGGVGFAITVPQSSRAPHMASDNRFYKRVGSTTAAMEEYEVRDVSRRQEAPDLKLELIFANGTKSAALSYTNATAPSDQLEFSPAIRNESAEPAQHASINIYVDARIAVDDVGQMTSMGDTTLNTPDGPIAARRYLQNWSIPGKMPIFLGIAFRVSDQPIRIRIPAGAGKYFIAWEVRAPRMTVATGYGVVTSDGSTVAITP